MSRIIVKNLPKKIKEERLREFFSSKGMVTDLQLKFTKEGVFRRFAFVGFKDEAQAVAAKEYFNNSYIDTSKIQVEMCAPLADTEKPRSWSKYSRDSSAYQRLHPQQQQQFPAVEEVPRANFADAFLKDLEGDEQFAEFLEVHGSSQRAAWGNDARPPPLSSDHRQLADEQAAGSGEEEPSCGSERPEEEQAPAKPQRAKPQLLPVQEFEFTLKVSGLPYKCKKKQIRDFFKPAKVLSLRLPPRVKGIAYLGFRREKDMKQALHKHHSFMAGRRIDVTRYTKKPPPEGDKKKKEWRQFEDLGKPQETLTDTGRLFIRNLSYTVTEEELQALFQKYGPLEEVHLSIDRVTRKPKGFAFVSFLFPEHAIRAFSELDGHMLQGRLLHLLPGKAKESAQEEQEEHGEPQSFKDKKEAELKKASGKGHNWNALFLGANALADVMAERYSTSKQELLGTETGESSVAVRMALGESQVVAETREFLEHHGVALDAFSSQTATERSRTTILVKNLPARTDPGELRRLFDKFGLLSRVVLPPWGVTALVEFQEPTEARAAFRHLAYSRFRHVPLYLEWAPLGVFRASKVEQQQDRPEVTVEPGDEEEEPPEPDTTLFVKNLSFATSEQALCQHFEQCGTVHEATIVTKKDLKHPGQRLSMGYGFVQFRRRAEAQRALKELQNSQLDGHALELRLSTRATSRNQETGQRPSDRGPEEGTKILVRNVPFQATDKEVRQLFSVFGSLRDVRLPRKGAGGSGHHRGFGFVDFLAKNDAKRAFEALCQSTHLYGRRLVLEWASTDDQEVDSLRQKTAHHFRLQGAAGGPSSKRLKKSDLLASLDAAAPDL